MEIINEESLVTKSDYSYLILNWIAIAFTIITITTVTILSFATLSTSLKIILTILSSSFSIYVASVYFLYTISFYHDRFIVNYFIRFPLNRSKVIELKSINGLRYTYTDGKGSGGIGTLRVYYSVNGQNNVLKCPLEQPDAAKIYKVIKESKITFDIEPKWVFNDYLD